MDKRRILFVVDSLGCGGAERSLLSLLSRLDYDKTDVSLLVMSRGGVFERFLPPKVQIITHQSPKGIRSAIFKVCRNIFSIKLRILRALSVKRHGAETYWSVMRAVYPHLPGSYDVAVAYHQGFPTYYVDEKVRSAHKVAWINTEMRKAGYRKSYNTIYYNRYDKIIAVSDTLKAQLIADEYVPSHKISTFYDILDADLIRSMSCENIDTRFGCDSGDMLLLATVGRMVGVKNYPLAVASACVLKSRGVRFRWVMVGDGSDRGNVESLISLFGLGEEIILTGMLPNPYPYIARCQIYVNTSKFEGFGLTLAEAKVLNKPIVTTDFPTAREQIRHLHNGMIVTADAECIADAIMQLYSDKKLYGAMTDSLISDRNKTNNSALPFM